MKKVISTGKKAMRITIINNVFYMVIAVIVSLLYSSWLEHLMSKYNISLSEVFEMYDLNSGESFVIIVATIAIVVFLIIFIVSFCYIAIGYAYTKKRLVVFDEDVIHVTSYGFPYTRDNNQYAFSRITEIKLNQSSLERIYGCGTIFIEGHAKANGSKDKFSIWIHNIDNAELLCEEIKKVLGNSSITIDS